MVVDPTIPLPTEEAVAKTKDFYLTKFGKVLTDPEAYEICSLVVGFLYLNILINTQCSDMDATPENPTTTAR